MLPERRLRFYRDRETRNTWVFKEEYPRGEQPVVGTLYVSKVAMEGMGNPDELVVEIRPSPV